MVHRLPDLSRAGRGAAPRGRAKRARAEQNRGGTGRASLCAALFPGREVMAGWYPYVARCPALLPAAWAQRIWRYLRTRGKHTGAQDSLRVGAQRVELLRQYRVL